MPIYCGMPLDKDYTFIWVYNTLTLEIRCTLWTEICDAKHNYMYKIFNNLKLA